MCQPSACAICGCDQPLGVARTREMSRIFAGVCPRYAASKPRLLLMIAVEQQVHVSASSTASSDTVPSDAAVRVISCTRLSFSQLRPSSQTNAARPSSSATADAYALSSPGCAAARFTSIGGVQCAPASLETAMNSDISFVAVTASSGFCDQ